VDLTIDFIPPTLARDTAARSTSPHGGFHIPAILFKVETGNAQSFSFVHQ
jgi:hypothetical protein